VLNNAKKKTTLSRFVVGDTVRMYGSIRQNNLSEIDVDTIRDLAF
jgi:tRNA(Ile2) C34 agmatinyltransferase TiaS